MPDAPLHKTQLPADISRNERGFLQPIDLPEVIPVKLNRGDGDANDGRFAEGHDVTVAVSEHFSRNNLTIAQRQNARSGTG